jgi:signal transduction histidine kinase
LIAAFATTGVVTGLILSVILLFLLIGLTRPFRRLNAAAAEISNGNYDKRVRATGRDEVADFARSFNLMAKRVGEHVAALSRMTESKQRFIDNLAHEIRTPVTAVIGYGELLKYANCDESETKTAIDHIIAQGKRMQNMSAKLLDLAYMENSIIEMQSVPLAAVFENAAAALKLRFAEKGLALRAEISPVAVAGDPDLLESLLTNLLDNAIDASEAGGAVRIGVKRTPEGVSVEIADSGKGMDATESARAVEPFYRADKSRSGGGNHAGLGLSLCAKICELHDAAFDIESEPGAGTTVRVLFIFTSPQQVADDSATRL